MSKRNRPGKRDRMRAKALANANMVSMDPDADYGRSCANVKATDFKASWSSRKWHYVGRNAARIHRG